jgi:catechol 2,3-dioxygenase-like lactoylglutathione lyase family enzyme
MNRIIPVLRIFDLAKAKEFYLDWLGFTLDWEHEFESGMPKYLQVTRGDLRLHLSEHHGEGTPGTKLFIEYQNLQALHVELTAKPYQYYRPGLERAFWNAWTMEVQDPFGNKLLFSEADE